MLKYKLQFTQKYGYTLVAYVAFQRIKNIVLESNALAYVAKIYSRGLPEFFAESVML
jgi:hypothetical protein